MKLLQFQRDAVDSVIGYYDQLQTARSQAQSEQGKKKLNAPSLAWLLHGTSDKPYCTISTFDGVSVPNVALCVPTGGGKTIIGASTAIELLNRTQVDQKNFIVWMVPTDAIYTQVLKDLSRQGKYYQFVLENYARRINIKTIDESWIDYELSPEASTILLLSFQSIIRKNSARTLQVYRNADKVSSLSVFSNSGLEPSLYSLIRIIKPIFIVDESHRYYTEIGRDFFRQNEIASLIIELSATHKQYSGADYPNIVYATNGKTLINEELIKKPIVYHSLKSATLSDVLKKALEHQLRIESIARETRAGFSPKVLISAEFTGAQKANQEYSAHNIKNILVGFGASPESIVIKSAELDEVGDANLDDPTSHVKFIITKRALMEGWDCKSVSTIVIVNNIGADITNFQLVGRGLRQPGKRYFKAQELNELHIFTNSSSHDDAVKKLTSFLSDSGLADTARELVVSSDNRVLHSLQLLEDRSIKVCSTFSGISSYDGVTLCQMLDQASSSLNAYCTAESEIPSAEELVQRIDFSRSQPVGLVQGRPAFLRELAAGINWRSKLQQYLFRQFLTFLPSSRTAFNLASEQVAIFSDHEHAYQVRAEIFLAVKNKVLAAHSDFRETFFRDNVLLKVQMSETTISETLGAFLEINVTPDLALDLPFKSCLYGNVPKSAFNSAELEFARFIDKFPNVKWIRNIPKQGIGFPYSKGNFYPDFILLSAGSARKSPVNALFIETKGAHLMGSQDSLAKKAAASALNKILVNTQIAFVDFEEARQAAVQFAEGTK